LSKVSIDHYLTAMNQENAPFNEHSTRRAGGIKKPPEAGKRIARDGAKRTPWENSHLQEPWKGERKDCYHPIRSPLQDFECTLNKPGDPLRYTPGYFLLALSGLDHFYCVFQFCEAMRRNGRAFSSLAAIGGGLLQDYQFCRDGKMIGLGWFRIRRLWRG
jgi:hypothetical protein